MMKMEDLFTTYWSQTLLLIGIAGYFLKRVFEHRTKKLEINHSLFQQYRIAAVNEYFSNFIKAQTLWDQLSVYEILEHKLSAKEIDAIIYPIINELNKSQIILKIYFADDTLNMFQELTNNINSVNTELKKQYFNNSNEINIIVRASYYDEARALALQRNSEIINNLSSIIKNTFKIFE